jgi:glucosamine 6-phosphate synthetase-like amidotransferase/phosphosugar isomerase protein
MCGIAAMSRPVGKSSIPDARQFIRSAARAIESRGEHATGAAWQCRDGWPYVWKSKGRAMSVVNEIPLPGGIESTIVHTRHATKGSVDENINNHPIMAPGIALVHNGRCTNDDELFEMLSDVYGRTAEVDSEAIAAVLAHPDHFGVGHVTEVLELVEGVAALAWMDTSTPGDLHLARLTGRPMTIGYTKRNDFVMSSTPDTLKMTAVLSGVNIQGVKQVSKGTYLRVRNGKIIEQRKFNAHEAAPVAEDVPTTYGRGGRTYRHDWELPGHDWNAMEQPVDPDNIDWGNLVTRRGW